MIVKKETNLEVSTSAFNARGCTCQKWGASKRLTPRKATEEPVASTGAGAADQSDDKRLKTQWDTLTLDKGHWQFAGAL